MNLKKKIELFIILKKKKVEKILQAYYNIYYFYKFLNFNKMIWENE